MSPHSRLFNVFAAAFSAAYAVTPKTPTVQWGACDPTIITNPVISCASFEVPLDYNDTSVGSATLALAKVNATLEPRLGTVFFNPGGPGDSGIKLLNNRVDYFMNFTGGHYDFVTWDPRGVGISTPGDIKCLDSLTEFQEVFNGTAQVNGIEMTGNFTDPEDLRVLFSQAGSLQTKYEEAVRRCIERNGDTLKYLGTSATVRDMVAMADALDGPGAPVNYYGISYGTFLGSVFLNMFPERVGRVIIDGVVDPHLWAQKEISLTWEQFYFDADDVYKGFVTGCALSGPDGCAISTQHNQTPSDVNDIVQSLMKTAHDATLTKPSVMLTSGQIRSSMLISMYGPPTWAADAAVWPIIVELVNGESSSGNTTQTSPANALDALRKRSSYGSMFKRQNAASDTNPTFALPAIACSDSLVGPHTGTNMTDVFQGLVGASRNISHAFGAAFPVNLYFCSFWPVRAVERYNGVFGNTDLANKILVIGNTFDPVTPFKFAQGVAESFGDKAALVRFNGFGHSSFEQASPCLLDITQAYMADGTLPGNDDTVCEAPEDLELFPGVNTQAILAELPNVGF